MTLNLYSPTSGTLRLRGLLAVMIAFLAIFTAISVLELSSAHASGLSYVVTNYDHDGTKGVFLRNSSNASNKTTKELYYGTTVTLVCYDPNGTAEGPGNTMWDKVTVTSGAYRGSVGWLSEHWLNTPVKANQHVSGEPPCSAPAPVSASAQKAINWATARLGSTAYNGLCLSFVRQAYSAAGKDLKSEISVTWGSNTYPQDIWGHFKAGRTGTGTPPAGALVFYLAKSGHSKTYSHVTIATDASRNTISTNDTVNRTSVHRESISQHTQSGAYNTYVGWWLP